MSFRAIEINHSYESGQDDLICDFYVPVLSNTVRYDRIAGFFSSSSLAVAAEGVASLIKNNGTMRIIACQKLSKNDIEMIEKCVLNLDEVINEKFVSDVDTLSDDFEKDHVRALGWMIANGYLEIKVALVYNENRICTEEEINKKAIFHQKVGILYDSDGNAISFSGSINETATGWMGNVEEFKVFKSWQVGQSFYLNDDIKKFDEYWNGIRKNVKIVDMPKATKEKLLEIGHDFNMDKIMINRYNKNKERTKLRKRLNLFHYQLDAVKKWKENGRNLMFEMATGTGKTRAAIGCIEDLLFNFNNVLIVISCPQNTLSVQWKTEIEQIHIGEDISLIADGTNHKWREELKLAINKLNAGFYHGVIVYSTHTTSSSEDFLDIINNISTKVKTFFVGDEAHGLGAKKLRKALILNYLYRLGLSATPQRWFDEDGTAHLYNYFGNDSYTFDIGEALAKINPNTGLTFLCQYVYKPKFIPLTEDELTKYIHLSNRITKLNQCSKSSDKYGDILEYLLFQRANIEKSAFNKYAMLSDTLDEIDDIKDTIIFVSPEQITTVMKMLGSKNIIASRFTQEEGTTSEEKYGNISERDYIIKKFKEGVFSVLVALKCLDEGIDIPSASRAIIMASSTNPREYIQRIGRIIRRSPGKSEATIYDFIIHPNLENIGNEELIGFETKIFNKEMTRVYEISKHAKNNISVLNEISLHIGGKKHGN